MLHKKPSYILVQEKGYNKDNQHNLNIKEEQNLNIKEKWLINKVMPKKLRHSLYAHSALSF